MPHITVLRFAGKQFIKTAIARAARDRASKFLRERGIDEGDLPSSGPLFPGGEVDEFGDLPL